MHLDAGTNQAHPENREGDGDNITVSLSGAQKRRQLESIKPSRRD
jgi:hypothetical protein